MTLADEFENYDSTTADSLEIGDLISLEDDFVEVNLIEDKGSHIYIEGYSYLEDEETEATLDPNRRLNLHRFVD